MCLSLWYWQNKAKLSACLSGLWRCGDGGLGSCGCQTPVRWCRTQSVITEHALTSTNSERQTQAINGQPPLDLTVWLMTNKRAAGQMRWLQAPCLRKQLDPGGTSMRHGGSGSTPTLCLSCCYAHTWLIFHLSLAAHSMSTKVMSSAVKAGECYKVTTLIIWNDKIHLVFVSCKIYEIILLKGVINCFFVFFSAVYLCLHQIFTLKKHHYFLSCF